MQEVMHKYAKDKLPISAIVVGLNEGELLPSCLSGIGFCDEILYFDLGSRDSSIEIAKRYGATVIHHKRVSHVELIHSDYINKTKYEWVLITDPDEVIDSELVEEIQTLFKQGLSDKIGAIFVPILFYFKNKALKGTAWGGINKRLLLANNLRFTFSTHVHAGRKLKQGFELLDLELKQKNVIHHYWMQGYSKLLEKHLRYLKAEGSARYDSGYKTSLKQIAIEPFRQFKYSYIRKKGYRDGIAGFALSLFWAWYQTSSLLALLYYSRKFKK